MEAWTNIVKQYRTGRVSFDDVTLLKRSPRLLKHTRDSTLRSAIDDAFLVNVANEVRRLPLSSKRLGRDWLPSKASTVNKNVNDDQWIAREHFRDLDDVCSHFTIRRFFPDAYTRMNMLIHVIRVFDRVAKVARIPYRIVFKGGVMMRLQLLEFLHDLHIDVRYEIIEYVSDAQGAVGVSDFDFEIVSDDDAQTEMETWRQVYLNSIYAMALSRYLEEHMYAMEHDPGERQKLLDNTWDHAEGEHELRDELRTAVENLSPDHPLHGATVDHVHIRHPHRPPPVLEHRTRFGRYFPVARDNIAIFKYSERGARDATDDVFVAPMHEVLYTMGCSKATVDTAIAKTGCLYVTTNMHIGEHAAQQHTHSLSSNFHLTRVKHAFVLYYTTKSGKKCVDRLSGEIIDLAQSHGPQHDQMRRHLVENVSRVYRDYPVLGTTDVIRSYTLEALIHDVQDVLHRGRTPPWENPKITKRLTRYALLLVLNVMNGEESMVTKLNSLDGLLRYVSTPHTIANRRMVRCRLSVVNAFADHEHMSASQHGISSRAITYYTQLKEYLARIVSIIEKNEERHGSTAWGATPLNALHMEYDDPHQNWAIWARRGMP